MTPTYRTSDKPKTNETRHRSAKPPSIHPQTDGECVRMYVCEVTATRTTISVSPTGCHRRFTITERGVFNHDAEVKLQAVSSVQQVHQEGPAAVSYVPSEMTEKRLPGIVCASSSRGSVVASISVYIRVCIQVCVYKSIYTSVCV